MSRLSFRRRARQWVVTLGAVAVMVPTLAHSHPRPGPQPEKSGETTYKVKEGDTLAGIARRHGVPLRQLILTNGLRRPDLLRPGQRLVIPASGFPNPPSGTANAGANLPAPRRSPSPPVPPANFAMGMPDLNGSTLAFRWPLEGLISSEFGRRRSGWHAGIDIRAEVGTPIFAAAAGTVYYSGWERFYGRVVKVEHEDGFVTVYAHNLQNFVEAGDVVEAGQVIATVGRTGRATTYHLHFEMRVNGKVFNPVLLLPIRDLEFVSDEEGQPDQDESE